MLLLAVVLPVGLCLALNRLRADGLGAGVSLALLLAAIWLCAHIDGHGQARFDHRAADAELINWAMVLLPLHVAALLIGRRMRAA